LRNAKSYSARIEAARQLGEHTNDPDLQLALVNIMKKDVGPKVKAALLESYGSITEGAEGTQKRFLDALKSDDTAIQRAGLKGLKNYKQESITKQLQTFSENESDTTLANQALRMYLQRVDSTKALDFTQNLIQQDTSGIRAIVAIGALAKRGPAKQANKYANFYIKSYYAYPVRKQALEVLIKHDTLAADWDKRLKKLMTDHDPRIRFLTVKGLPDIRGVDTGSIISKYKPREYDARVYKMMMAVDKEP
jgi:HEAT repeat protein